MADFQSKVKQLLGLKDLTVGMVLMRLRTFIALFVITLAFTIMLSSKGINFLAPINIITITKHVALTALLGIGMTFVILTGGIDLSVGSIVGLCGMIAGGLINEGLVLNIFGITVYFHVIVIILITLVLGTALGWFNGMLITKFKVAPFIATLGMLYMARGFANIRSKGATFPNLQENAVTQNTGFAVLGSGKIIGIPISIWIMLIVFALALYVSRKTPLGRHIFAIGGNKRAAALSGIQVNKITTLVYMFSGFCAAMVGLIISSQLVASHPATGESYEMNAIAAVVLGGTSLAGGIGSVSGTIIGAFVIGVLGDGLVMFGVSEFWQNVIKGIVIVTAVILDQLQQGMKAKAAVSSRKEVVA
jgi:ribose/xylose/arabinose/galactoside ABC-type transport system permease subunit